jgi:ssDNA-binding Zn-finger/Zn-ribbon topoisomerase 1
LFVEDIGDSLQGSVNGTSINGEERIPKNTPYPLTHKDRLAIAHLKFNIEIKSAQVQNPDVIEETFVWVVVCPECGKWYKVSDSSERVINCDGCDDQSYANEISKVKATQRREADWKLRE